MESHNCGSNLLPHNRQPPNNQRKKPPINEPKEEATTTTIEAPAALETEVTVEVETTEVTEEAKPKAEDLGLAPEKAEEVKEEPKTKEPKETTTTELAPVEKKKPAEPAVEVMAEELSVENVVIVWLIQS